MAEFLAMYHDKLPPKVTRCTPGLHEHIVLSGNYTDFCPPSDCADNTDRG